MCSVLLAGNIPQLRGHGDSEYIAQICSTLSKGTCLCCIIELGQHSRHLALGEIPSSFTTVSTLTEIVVQQEPIARHDMQFPTYSSVWVSSSCRMSCNPVPLPAFCKCVCICLTICRRARFLCIRNLMISRSLISRSLPSSLSDDSARQPACHYDVKPQQRRYGPANTSSTSCGAEQYLVHRHQPIGVPIQRT